MAKKKVRYEVWALGYDAEQLCTDVEEFLGSFTDKNAAIEHAKKFKDISYVYDQATIDGYLEPGDYMEIVVETIREGDLSNTNIETVYSNMIYMPEAPKSSAFSLIPDWQTKNLRCHFCGETRSVKYSMEVHNPIIHDGPTKVAVCNKCALQFKEVNA